MTRAYIDGPFGQIHYRQEGEGVPLLLLHQALLSQRQFEAAYAPLTKRGIQVIGLDLPGHGQSDPVPDLPSIADFALAASALVETLGFEGLHVLGHHTGAQVGTEFALRWPDKTRSLILNGPLPMSAQDRAAGLAYVEEHEKGLQYKRDGSHLTRLFKNRTAYAPDGTDWATATRYVAEAFAGLGPLWHGHYAAFTHDHGAAIAALQVPTLILTNTGDAIYENAKICRQLRPDFEYVELDGGGVDIVDEATAAWVDAVSDFVLRAERD